LENDPGPAPRCAGTLTALIAMCLEGPRLNTARVGLIESPSWDDKGARLSADVVMAASVVIIPIAIGLKGAQGVQCLARKR
jgi:hypothetical protein